mgnify:CR=1 FL=1
MSVGRSSDQDQMVQIEMNNAMQTHKDLFCIVHFRINSSTAQLRTTDRTGHIPIQHALLEWNGSIFGLTYCYKNKIGSKDYYPYFIGNTERSLEVEQEGSI